MMCVSCRLKEEYLAKLKPLQELNEQLLAEASAKQQDSVQLAAVLEQLACTKHRLEHEAGGRAELWQRSGALEQELQVTSEKLAVATKSLKRAEHQLGALQPGFEVVHTLSSGPTQPLQLHCQQSNNCREQQTHRKFCQVLAHASAGAEPYLDKLAVSWPLTMQPCCCARVLLQIVQLSWSRG